jgi:hypothetical protein
MNKFWWRFKSKKDSAGAWQDVFATVNFLTEKQSYRSRANLKHIRLYGNMDTLGLTVGTYASERSGGDNDRKLRLNVVQSVVDTVISKVTKESPRVMFLTDGGNFTQRQRAKKLNKFVDGQFYAANSYDNGEMAATDACVAGTGFTKVFIDQGKVCEERVFPNEILVDDAEAFYGKPRHMYQVKSISKEVLKEVFPDYVMQIDTAKGVDASMMRSDFTVDQIKVVESWHLPSGPDAPDGKHAICIDGATLEYDDYDFDVFPVVPLKWTERLTGFYGQGIAEQLAPIQLEINKTLKTIQMSLHLCGVPHWLKEKGAKIVSAHLDNMIGGIITYSGTPPSLQAPNPVPQQLIEHLQRLVQYAYEQVGVSMLSAQGRKPAGVDAGVALRELIDIESDRFSVFQKRYEQYYVDKAKLHIELTKKLVEEDSSLSVYYKGKKGLEKIKWKDVQLDEDQYIMQPFPTAFLPKTPAGKFQMVQELVQAGFLQKEDAIKLLDFPDIEGTTNLLVAAANEMDMVIERIIEENEYVAPEPFQNLEYGIQKMQGAYLQSKMTNVPEDRLEKLRRWMNEASIMMSPPQAMPMGEAPPTAVPEAPPTSDLLANAPIQ